jgi:CRISPR type IV-associated protein Csf3
MQGLRINIFLSSPVVTFDGKKVLHMDSILSYAQISTEISNLTSNVSSPMVINVDGLMKIWGNGAGRPLYAISDLYPVGRKSEFQEYANKKFPSSMLDFSKKTGANIVAGRYKEQRKSLNTIYCEKWQSIAIGDKEKISVLLDRVSNVGGRVNCGFGRISHYEILRDDSISIDMVLMHRNIPAEIASNDIKRPLSFGGWTPPYWHSPFYGFIVEGEENALF